MQYNSEIMFLTLTRFEDKYTIAEELMFLYKLCGIKKCRILEPTERIFVFGSRRR